MKKVFCLSFLIVFLLITVPTVSAHHREKILGVTTNTSETITIPPTASGPGFVLPDSPLFFLDPLKQNVRIIVALTPDAKAVVYNDVAGERLAELRYMLAKKNQQAVAYSLNGVSDNMRNASEELAAAQFAGKNVKKLARILTISIKEKQQALDVLENNASLELKSKVKVAQDSLLTSKVIIEDSLSQEELENEIRDDLSRLAIRRIAEIAENAQEIEHDLEELAGQAQEVSRRVITKRQEALEVAIAQKNKALELERAKLLAAEKVKQEDLLRMQQIAIVQGKKAVQQALESAQSFVKAQKSVNDIYNQDVMTVTPVSTVTPTPRVTIQQ